MDHRFLLFTGSVLIGMCLASNPIALLGGATGVLLITIAPYFKE